MHAGRLGQECAAQSSMYQCGRASDTPVSAHTLTGPGATRPAQPSTVCPAALEALVGRNGYYKG
eukprot:1235513-Alexandrium_andersonii.AAC.1